MRKSMIGDPPTPRQGEILACLRAHLAANGFPPTLRTIAARIGVSSPYGVLAQLRLMAKKGLVRRVGDTDKGRWLPTVDEGCCPCCRRPLEGQP